MKRRIKCGVYAFGGNITSTSGSTFSSNLSSIFRNKTGGRYLDSAQPKPSQHRLNYENQLVHRYYENQTRLSWEVEENPPVECGMLERVLPVRHMKGGIVEDPSHDTSMQLPKTESQDEKRKNKETPKTRYRCKLCGQPKQNHICPYQQSLQRSIGTMSYPALNAFESSEPGKLAPSLIEMNNFFHTEENQNDMLQSITSTTTSGLEGDSFISLHNLTPKKKNPTNKRPCISETETDYLRTLKCKKRKITIQSSFVRKASDIFSEDKLLLEKAEIKSEQYRVVSATSTFSSDKSYVYPTVPLTYAQRRCMSDSLFNLCKERQGLIDECSYVLCEAKETDDWDLAVAELITQVIVVLHCPIGDKMLEGLRRYLMAMGISC